MTGDTLIAITQDKPLAGEAALWVQLLELGVHKIHVRKPGWSTEQLVALVQDVPEAYRKRLVIHRDIVAAIETDVGGLHLPWQHLIKGRIYLPSDLTLSASVHSWKEAQMAFKLCGYCFISPVYNSISKDGYMANPELMEVPHQLRQKRIYALGGMHPDYCAEALDNGYYGVAALGYLWQDPEQVLNRAKKLLEALCEESLCP